MAFGGPTLLPDFPYTRRKASFSGFDAPHCSPFPSRTSCPLPETPRIRLTTDTAILYLMCSVYTVNTVRIHSVRGYMLLLNLRPICTAPPDSLTAFTHRYPPPPPPLNINVKKLFTLEIPGYLPEYDPPNTRVSTPSMTHPIPGYLPDYDPYNQACFPGTPDWVSKVCLVRILEMPVWPKIEDSFL